MTSQLPESGPDLGAAAERDADGLTSHLERETTNGERILPIGLSGDAAGSNS